MTRRTLLDFFADLSALDGEFIAFDDGYRTWSYTYAQVAAAAHAFAARLRAQGIGKGRAVAVWGENRAEWIVALWGCLIEGVVLVPIDYRASAEFLARVATIVDARAILVGDAVDRERVTAQVPVWALAEMRPGDSDPVRPKADATAITADDTAEIIFTSGATSDPKGVVITHRNILANIVPIEREMAKYKKYARPFLPIRFLNLLPLSHMFGQAMATFIPPMLPGTVVFMRSYAPEDIARGRDIRGKCAMEDVLRDVAAAAEKAAEAGKVGIVGYCWGGLIVYVAACRMGDKLSCASGYYGGNIVSYLNEKPAVPLILHFGALDASIPMADIDRIRAAHPDMRVHVYEGADHGFNCDQRRQFNDEAARIAQRRTLDLFATHLA